MSPESLITPLGETLQRARLARGVTLEEAERTTRISRRYLEALENENFGLLPAPVYARGFLRTYARYLGLEPSDLLPLFPVGYLDVPLLEPMPKVTTPRTWPGSGLLAAGVVAVLLLVVVGLYAMGGSEGGSQSLFGVQTQSPESGAGVGEETPTGPRAVAPITVEPALTATPARPSTCQAATLDSVRGTGWLTGLANRRYQPTRFVAAASRPTEARAKCCSNRPR